MLKLLRLLTDLWNCDAQLTHYKLMLDDGHGFDGMRRMRRWGMGNRAFGRCQENHGKWALHLFQKQETL